jgi:hypothetical protein
LAASFPWFRANVDGVALRRIGVIFFYRSDFLLMLRFLRQKSADFLDFYALRPFSELGFSLTLAVWFTRKGAFTRHRQVDQM